MCGRGWHPTRRDATNTTNLTSNGPSDLLTPVHALRISGREKVGKIMRVRGQNYMHSFSKDFKDGANGLDRLAEL